MARQYNYNKTRFPTFEDQAFRNSDIDIDGDWDRQDYSMPPSFNNRTRCIPDTTRDFEAVRNPSSLPFDKNYPVDLKYDDLDDPIGVPSQIISPQRTHHNFSNIKGIAEKYNINPDLASRLEILTDCDVVILCDDSGSMITPMDTGVKTRWDELQQIVNIVIDVCSAICSKGVDVCFLNRKPVLSVKNPESIKNAFVTPPRGLTPLSPTLRSILSGKKNLPDGRKLLILIATDGAPTDPKGEEDINTLESILKNERAPNVHVTFLACTDDLNAVSYLNGWDETMSNLDVVDDYISERAQVQEAHGAKFPFSFGDYIAKALIGSLDSWLGELDDKN